MAHPEFSVFISLSPDLKLRPYRRKVWQASWVSLFLMTREKKKVCLLRLSSQAFVKSTKGGGKSSPKARQDLNVEIPSIRAFVEASGRLLFPHVCLPLSCPLLWKEPTGLFSAYILMAWPTEPSRGKCKWPTWAYVQDFLLRPRGDIYFESNLLVEPSEADE